MIAVSKFEMEVVLDIIKTFAWDCDVRAFGSRYKGTYAQTSDLDLAFVKKDKSPLTLYRISRLKEAFELSNIPYVVDVVDYYSCSEEFKKIIDNGNFTIFEGKAGNFDDGRKFYVLGDIINIIKGNTLDFSSAKLLNEGDTVIAIKEKVGAIAMVGQPMAISVDCFGIQPKGDEISQKELYHLLKDKMPIFKSKNCNVVGGEIIKDDIESICVRLPIEV